MEAPRSSHGEKDEDEDEGDFFAVSDEETIEEQPDGSTRFRALAQPTVWANRLLGVPLDPYIVRPQDLLRRAFDELAFALHYFVVGAMVATKGGIYFQAHKEYVAHGTKFVFDLPVITRRDGNRTYTLVNSSRWRKTNTTFQFDRADDLITFKEFNTSIHSHEVGLLLQHIAATAKSHWRWTNDAGRPLFGEKTSELARKLFYLRNYLTHRNFLAEASEHCQAVAAIGDDVFCLIFELVKGDNCLKAGSIGGLFVKEPFQAHVSNLENLRKIFRHLCSTFYTPGKDLDTSDESRRKLQSVVRYLSRPFEERRDRDDMPIIPGPEYFAVVYVSSRFILWRNRAEEQESIEAEDDGDGGDGDGDGDDYRPPKNSIFHVFKSARFSYESATFECKPAHFPVLDPFSVTHVDMLNRAFDYLVLAIKEMLRIGVCHSRKAPGAKFLARLFLAHSVSGPILEPYGEGNCDLGLISKRVRLWRKKKQAPALSQQEHFEEHFKSAKMDLVLRLFKESPYVNDPRYLLEFLSRALDPFYTFPGGEALQKASKGLTDIVRQDGNNLVPAIVEMISFRDCLGHQSNLVHATRLRVDRVLAAISSMRSIQNSLRKLLLGDFVSEDGKGWFELLPELQNSLSTRDQSAQLANYAAFRRRQKIEKNVSDSATRQRIRDHATRIVKHLHTSPELLDIVRCQTSLYKLITPEKAQTRTMVPDPQPPQVDNLRLTNRFQLFDVDEDRAEAEEQGGEVEASPAKAPAPKGREGKAKAKAKAKRRR